MGKRVWFPVVSGPLAPYAAGFEVWLRSRSYSSSATANRLCQLDRLSRWLERWGLTVGELSAARVAEFASSRREAGLVTWTTPQSVALPLEYLREIGVMPSPVARVASGPLEALLADYGRYLRVERRLAEHTVRDAYLPAARLFVAGREGLDGLGLQRLSAADREPVPGRGVPEAQRDGRAGSRERVAVVSALPASFRADGGAASVGGSVGR